MTVGEFLKVACDNDDGKGFVEVNVFDLDNDEFDLYGGRYKNALNEIIIPQKILDMEVYEMDFERWGRCIRSDYINVCIYVHTKG